MYFESVKGKYTRNTYCTYLLLNKWKKKETFNLHYCMFCNNM